MIRTLRVLAAGARTQLRDELAPEFADVGLRNLNPRPAISRAILGEDADKLQNFNPRRPNRASFPSGRALSSLVGVGVLLAVGFPC